MNITFEWTINKIPPQSHLSLEIVWSPLKVISCREVIQIGYDDGNKKEVSLILKSRELKKGSTRKSTVRAFPKKLKLKSPSPPRHFMLKTSAHENLKPLGASPRHNATNVRMLDALDRITFTDKENSGPLTPKNASALFDNIRFTPQTETKPKWESKLEYLTSLPTPTGVLQRDDIVMTEITARRNIMEVSLNDRSTVHRRLEAVPEIHVGFDTFTASGEDAIEMEIGIKEQTSLFVISEERFQQTFDVHQTESITKLIPVDSPRRIMSESLREPRSQKMRTNQGSMPNLNEIDDEVGSIEHNRYFYKQRAETLQQNLSMDSVVSNADFRETEICAQSSRLNLNLLDLSPEEPPIVSHVKNFPQMTFSPPARSTVMQDMQRRETFDIPAGGRMIRATTWKQQQNKEVFAVPKVPRELNLRSTLATQSLTSLSTASLASAGSTSSMPATLTKGRLYNENHINAYNRKDPFSASTTNDPFLSSTMYLDEKTLDGIERTYMKWLNALVTLPCDLESDRNEKIDVGKLFNDVQSKELTLAPTKESVVSRYYTSRLDTLRTTAVRFFHSEEIATPLNKLVVMMNEKNKLDIKVDRRIDLDLVVQRGLLELLLCYNPLWLRIGLEVVFNVQLNLSSNQDIYGMSRFIITNMFKSPYLAEKYSKHSQQKEYLEKLGKFTVKNFLFVLFFLDRAKEGRMIKQNPCLFVRRAPYKESNEILKRFASLVLANYGDIIRMLRRFDFVLSHKQTVIDEFDYAFKNLAVDLRDGVRLTKVMEIILMRDDLVKKVRVPGEDFQQLKAPPETEF